MRDLLVICFTAAIVVHCEAKPLQNDTSANQRQSENYPRRFPDLMGPVPDMIKPFLENMTSADHAFIRLDTNGHHEYLPVSSNNRFFLSMFELKF